MGDDYTINDYTLIGYVYRLPGHLDEIVYGDDLDGIRRCLDELGYSCRCEVHRFYGYDKVATIHVMRDESQ